MIDLNTIITSDHHFYHKNITQFEPNRVTAMRIDGYEDHEEWIYENWNSSISKNTNVLYLGDFAFKEIEKVSNNLNGNISLILGNHDRKGKQVYKDLHQVFNGTILIEDIDYQYNLCIQDDPLMSGVIKEIQNYRILFSHYPLFNDCEYDIRNERIRKRIKFLEYLYIKYNCNLNIHGHTHSNKSTFKNAINVSFDYTKFRYLTLNEHILNYQKKVLYKNI